MTDLSHADIAVLVRKHKFDFVSCSEALNFRWSADKIRLAFAQNKNLKISFPKELDRKSKTTWWQNLENPADVRVGDQLTDLPRKSTTSPISKRERSDRHSLKTGVDARQSHYVRVDIDLGEEIENILNSLEQENTSATSAQLQDVMTWANSHMEKTTLDSNE